MFVSTRTVNTIDMSIDSPWSILELPLQIVKVIVWCAVSY